MTLYRETSTGTIWGDQELLVSLASEIGALDDDTLLKREYVMYGDIAIHEYVIECCLVGIYDDLDGDDALYRCTADGQEMPREGGESDVRVHAVRSSYPGIDDDEC